MSILIPAYNAERWIAETLRSALAQTWKAKEIIVVNDGSTDRTEEIARQFEPQGIRVVTQKNEGAAAARNTAFSLCRGDYIQWLDADDLLAPDKIERQMEALPDLENKRLLLSGGFAKFKYRYHRAKFLPGPLWRDLAPLDWLLCKLGQDTYMQTSTWLVSRELAQAAGPWNNSLLGDDDGEYFCRVVLASNEIRFLSDAKVFYRQPGFDRLSSIGRSDKKLESQFLSINLHISYLRSLEESERVRTACLAYLQTWFGWFLGERPDLARELEDLATSLGGRLKAPRLPWKYLWIQKLFGWTVAKRVRQRWNQYKSSAMIGWDKVLFRLKSETFQSGLEPAAANPAKRETGPSASLQDR